MSLAALALLAGRSFAQEAPPGGGFDAHGFQLVAHDGDLRDPLAIQRPGAFVQGDWFLSGLAEYARAPLVRVVSAEAGGGEDLVEPVVDNLVVLNLSGGVALHDRIRLDLKAPVYGLSTGPDLAADGPAMGDLRASAMLVGVRPRHVEGGGGFGLGLVGHVDLPSGTPSRFLGQSGVAGGFRLAATYEAPTVTLSADLGTQFNPSLDVANLQGTDALLAGIGVGFLTSDTVGVTIEAVGQPPLQASSFEFVRTLPPAEAILSLRYVTRSGGFWTFGGAGGLTDGPGVAAFRVFVGGGFADLEPPRPPDADPVGLLRASDLCPTEPETVNGWKDDDGCPDQLGTLGIDVRYRGQPRSADAEIVGPDGRRAERVGPQGLSLDAVPGSSWSVKAVDGCLAGEASAVAAEGGSRLLVELAPVYDARILVEVIDAADAPIPTAVVAWQSERQECVPGGVSGVDPGGRVQQEIAAGSHRLVVTAPSYNVHDEVVELIPGDDRVVRVRLAAAKLVVEKKQIRILEKVQFEFGKAVIRPESFDLLDQVAAVILTNPDLGRVEVGGHTDNKGSDEFNQKLSEDRANAVRDYLVKRGVAADRLLAVGYGEIKPIDTNKTEAGREANRRVEFQLIDQPDEASGAGGTP